MNILVFIVSAMQKKVWIKMVWKNASYGFSEYSSLYAPVSTQLYITLKII